jgi:hypothetical protein
MVGFLLLENQHAKRMCRFDNKDTTSTYARSEMKMAPNGAINSRFSVSRLSSAPITTISYDGGDRSDDSYDGNNDGGSYDGNRRCEPLPLSPSQQKHSAQRAPLQASSCYSPWMPAVGPVATFWF